MQLLGQPVSKKDWLDEVADRNGVSSSGAGISPKKSLKDAGPWESTVKKIVAFRSLGRDWDGLGAIAPPLDLLESAVGLAYLLNEAGVVPPQCVVPGVDGSVTLEWHEPDGTYREIEIDHSFHAEVMVVEPGRPAKHWTLPTE